MNRFRTLLLLLSLAPVVCLAQSRPAEVDAILASMPGNAWTALVENESGSLVYYQHDPNTGLAPASNTKLFTTAAAFGLLGTNYVFETRLYADGPLTNGVLKGNLNLLCFHDPTWNTSVFTNARTPLDHIAAQLKALGVTAIANNVQCYGACAYNLSSVGFLVSRSVQARNAEAAEAFLAALKAQGIEVSGTARGETGFTAPGTLLYTHHSSDLTYKGKPLQLDVACIPLLKVSHNIMADLLCRHLGWKLAREDSYNAGAPLVLQWLGGCAGLNTNGMVLNDGSGLSRRNRFSATQCVALTRYMLTAFPSWQEGLPVGCVDGTIGKRFCGTSGASQVHAKTGSLGIAISLSGYLENKFDHQRYLFSFIANRTNIDQTATRKTIDEAVVQFTAPPPVQPQVLRDNNQLTLTWTPITGLKYRLQYKDSLSDPTWQTQGAELTATNATVLTVNASLSGVPQRFYRVQATE
jgi:D-alanyl-D-alanine carboxypeptidase